ncbi:BRO1 domain-containing protein [Phanerochaete sordida]|uniref:pH-response regulator protein palC n=1 Tax=Phanerochaete sordida TaxID=48140 RepID=A0A9P3GE40_9APHY|nr:BRO1 domain-containing protein [Phanerochaete sordida]
MTSYLYELPTTGAISFGDFLYDKSASYISEISDTTEARANLRAALKESKRTDEKDFLRLVKVLDDYIPKLCGIIAAVNAGEVVVKAEPIFSWRTTLSDTLFHSSPRLSVPSLAAELAFTLLTYAFALSNMARAVVASLGAYEFERGISDAERKVKDERLGFAVTLLCKAAGIFEYIAKEVIADWDAAREKAVAAGMQCPNPPDLSREVLIGLSKTALADAQNLAVRKLLTRAAFDSTVTPGPPLPKSHPSPALAAKLHLECAALYSSARALVKNPGASRPAVSPQSSKSKFRLGIGKDKSSSGGAQESSADEVVPELRRYLADEVLLHQALAHKWLGVDAGENTQQGAGTAVGFLDWARKDLDELRGGASGVHIGVATDRERDMREARKVRVQVEAESVGVFYKGYKRMNDSMSFQPVPPQADLQASIPAGRMAVTIRPYTRPVPAFGPGSPDYVQQYAEALDALALEDQSEDQTATPSPPPLPPAAAATTSRAPVGNYAGAGSYF